MTQRFRWPAALLAALALVSAGCGGTAARHTTPQPTATAPGSRNAAGEPRELADRLQHALDRARQEVGAPGASAAVIGPGSRLWLGTSGFADVRRRQPVTVETLFEAGSITKTLVAALVLRLAEDHVLRLDDHLDRWVPRFPNAHRITLRQLLNHTAGTRNFTDSFAFGRAQRREPDAVWRPQRDLGYATTPRGAPGAEWAYSNTDYILLGLVIERATRSTLATELHRRLLPRSGFPRLVLQGDERPTGAVATGYQDIDLDGRPESFRGHPYIPTTSEATAAWAAGGIATSAQDLARAIHGILTGTLISTQSRHEMTRWVEVGNDPRAYGLGLERVDEFGPDAWGHAGDITGFHADAWFLPNTGVTVVVLSNLQAQGRLNDRIADDLIAVVSDPRR